MPNFDTFRFRTDQDNSYQMSLYMRKIQSQLAKADPRNYKQMVTIYAENEEVDLRQLDSHKTYHEYRDNIIKQNIQLPLNKRIPLAPFPKGKHKSFVKQFLDTLLCRIK